MRPKATCNRTFRREGHVNPSQPPTAATAKCLAPPMVRSGALGSSLCFIGGNARVLAAAQAYQAAEEGGGGQEGHEEVGSSPSGPKPRFKAPWISTLMRCLAFVKIFSIFFKREGHITLQEGRSCRMLIRWLGTFFPDSRPAIALDPSALLGSNSKGRASAEAFNDIHRTTLPTKIGAGLYPGE